MLLAGGAGPQQGQRLPESHPGEELRSERCAKGGHREAALRRVGAGGPLQEVRRTVLHGDQESPQGGQGHAHRGVRVPSPKDIQASQVIIETDAWWCLVGLR